MLSSYCPPNKLFRLFSPYGLLYLTMNKSKPFPHPPWQLLWKTESSSSPLNTKHTYFTWHFERIKLNLCASAMISEHAHSIFSTDIYLMIGQVLFRAFNWIEETTIPFRTITVYPFHREGFFCFQWCWRHASERTVQRSFVVGMIWDASAKFPHLCFWIFLISPSKIKFWLRIKPVRKWYGF